MLHVPVHAEFEQVVLAEHPVEDGISGQCREELFPGAAPLRQLPLVVGDADTHAASREPDHPDPVAVAPQVQGEQVSASGGAVLGVVPPHRFEHLVRDARELSPQGRGLETVVEHPRFGAVAELGRQHPAPAGAVDDPAGLDTALCVRGVVSPGHQVRVGVAPGDLDIGDPRRVEEADVGFGVHGLAQEVFRVGPAYLLVHRQRAEGQLVLGLFVQVVVTVVVGHLLERELRHGGDDPLRLGAELPFSLDAVGEPDAQLDEALVVEEVVELADHAGNSGGDQERLAHLVAALLVHHVIDDGDVHPSFGQAQRGQQTHHARAHDHDIRLGPRCSRFQVDITVHVMPSSSPAVAGGVEHAAGIAVQRTALAQEQSGSDQFALQQLQAALRRGQGVDTCVPQLLEP